jgi:transposase
MAYREGDRYQQNMFPPSLDELIDEQDAVRIYDAFVEQLDIERLGLQLNDKKEGNPEYHPKSMLKILLYGYSYGIRSSRKLERATNHNITFMWLSGGLKPDHKTISLFRKRNKKILKKVFRQCVELCIKLNVIEGNTLYVDGTKIRANAGIKHSYTKAQAKARIAELEKKITRMLNECEKADKLELNQGSWIKLNEQLNTAQKRKEAIESAMGEILEEENSVNLTDPDCKLMTGRQGSHASYNVQLVTDDKAGLIVSNDVVNENNDCKQLAPQIRNAQEILETKIHYVVADKGYSNLESFKAVSESNMTLVIPQINYANRQTQSQYFNHSKFKYNPQLDCYHCPTGNLLLLSNPKNQNPSKKYQIQSPKLCVTCAHFGVCTTSLKGRSITRHYDEPLREKISAFYHSDLGQTIYRKRGQIAEIPFGHIKRNMGISSFLLRQFSGVQAEMDIIATCYNLTRLITLYGALQLRQKLQSP